MFLKKLLPLGTVKIHGLIFTGEDSAFDSVAERPCWGVIMVREVCIRPAHFLPAPEFKPHPVYSDNLRSDISRTRNVNKNFARSFENHNEFVVFVGKYLGACANQFAFARVARIMHATLSPSNISIDGRWLDLPLSSFLTGGKNHKLSSTFYNEPSDALSYAIEMLHTYSKYNGVILNPDPLIKYYNEQIAVCFRHHIGFMLVLPAEKISTLVMEEWNKIADIISLVIHSAKYVDRARSTPDNNDPIVALLIGLFGSTVDIALATSYFDKTGLSKSDIKVLAQSFNKVIDCAYHVDGNYAPNKNSYLINVCISSLKRSVLSGVFYLSEVEREIKALCENGSPNEISEFIDSYDSCSDWIFNDCGNEVVTLFLSEDIHIIYIASNSIYRIYIKRNVCLIDGSNYLDLFDFKCFSALMDFVENSVNVDVFYLRGFNCRSLFFQLSNVIPLIEKYNY